jgi:2,3,4,5-tetrahydropyridine-2-carboxylate N-succinyltransferase
MYKNIAAITLFRLKILTLSLYLINELLKSMINELKSSIEASWAERSLLNEGRYAEAVRSVVDMLDKGELRTAEPTAEGTWQVNEWVKKGVLLYFSIEEMRTIRAGELEFYDKIALKHGFSSLGVRVVPQATARYGSFIAPGVIMMPSYVNIGAYVDEGTMVDTWVTVGSCAQIGKRVHLSGGVGIGGVLEPVQAAPVIVEDECFIGSRCIVVEGAHIGARAVLGANVVVTGSTHIIDVTGEKPVEYKGYVPAGSIVIPGTYPKTFAAGTYGVPCGLIIGRRNAATDLKTSLNDALREYNVPV